MAGHIKYLTRTERALCLKCGAAMAALKHQMAAPVEKEAQLSKILRLPSTVVDTGVRGLKGVAMLSLVAGIPMGTAAHIVDKQLKKKRIAEEELKEQATYFRDASKTMESGLAAAT